MSTIVGTNGNDHLTGTNSVDLILGGAGDDKIEGLGGNDSLGGDAGNDIIAGGAGDNNLNGGDGDDTFIVTGGSNIIEGGAGFDTVDYSTLPPSAEVNDSYTSIEHIIGSSHDDTFTVTLNPADVSLEGHDGDDILTTGSGNDHLSGGNGNDILDGGAGHNVYDGGAGFDTVDEFSLTVGDKGTSTFTSIEDIIGSSHNNSYTFTGNSRITIDGGAGDDVVTGGSASDTLTGGQGNDTLNGGGGNDLLLALGNTMDDAIAHAFDADGKNTMSGGDGNDELVGGGNNDTLDGGAGQDILIGGGGNNHITGGAGADFFTFGQQEGAAPSTPAGTVPPSHDVVTDFNAHEDVALIVTIEKGFNPLDHIMDTAAGAVMDLGDGQTITFDNVHAADLNAHNVQVSTDLAFA